MMHDFPASPTVCTFCRYVRQLLWQVSPFLLGLGLLMLAYEVESRYFPVIKDFKVLSVTRTHSGVMLRGTMRKVRDCEFLQLTAYIDDAQPVNVTFLDSAADAKTRTRVVGFQFWGPWEIGSETSPRIDLYSRHQCHLLWQQGSKLLTLVVPANILAQEK